MKNFRMTTGPASVCRAKTGQEMKQCIYWQSSRATSLCLNVRYGYMCISEKADSHARAGYTPQLPSGRLAVQNG